MAWFACAYADMFTQIYGRMEYEFNSQKSFPISNCIVHTMDEFITFVYGHY